MAQKRSIRRPLRRFAQVSYQCRALVVEAVAWLLLARLALIFIPFPRLARSLGAFVAPNDARALRARSKGSREQIEFAEEVGLAVTRFARYAPFRAVCLSQAMAARVMLKRRGVSSVLHFGAGRGKDKPLDADARLNTAGVEVTGYPVAKYFAEIACFV